MFHWTRLLTQLSLASFLLTCVGFCPSLSHGQATEPEVQPVRPVTLDNTPSETAIDKALHETTELEFIEAPLHDVARYLGQRHQINLKVDDRELETVGLSGNMPVTFQVKGIPLRSALTLMLRELELMWVVRNEVVLITTYETNCGVTITQLYDVRDLMCTPWSDRLDIDSMYQLISTMIAPTTWDELGGMGSMSQFNGTLVVSQTEHVHRELQGMLSQLRMIHHTLKSHPEQAFGKRWDMSPPPGSKSEKRIRSALKTKLPEVEFVETPLHEVMEYLQHQQKIPILLDARRLKALKVKTDTPITVQLRNVSLRSALSHMLRPYGLAATIEHDVLIITSAKQAEPDTISVGFVVRDLLGTPDFSREDSDSLIDLITSTVAPATWEGNGGQSSLNYYEPTDTLIITQTEEVLREVEDLLATLRKVQQMHEAWSAEKWKKQQEEYLNTPQFYRIQISLDHTGELVLEPELVKSLVEEQLSADGRQRAKIKLSTESLTMLLTPRERAKVDRMIQRTGLPLLTSSRHGSSRGGFHGQDGATPDERESSELKGGGFF